MPNEMRGAECPPGMRDLSTNERRSADATAMHTRRDRRRARRGALAIAGAASVLVLTAALAACASTKSVGPAAAGGTLTGVPATSASPLASASGSSGSGSAVSSSASPGTTSSVNPGGPMQGGTQLANPEAQAGSLPAGAKYVPIEQVGRSADGRTLYLEIMARGGACGRYVVVVQESASQVAVGMAQLPVKVGVMCPMLVRIADFPAHLSAPLGNRPVIDLASGRPAGSVGVIPLPLPGSVNSGVTSNR